jgi:hypothetical protein
MERDLRYFLFVVEDNPNPGPDGCIYKVQIDYAGKHYAMLMTKKYEAYVNDTFQNFIEEMMEVAYVVEVPK